MLDIKYIREHAEEIAEGARRKRIDFDVAALLAADERRRTLQLERDRLREERKKRSKAIGQLKAEERQAAIDAMAELNQQVKTIEAQAEEAAAEFDRLMLRCPNPPAPDVPLGETDADNVEFRRVGEARRFDFEPLDHVALGEQLGVIEIARAVKLAGTRNYILAGPLARMHFALLHFAMDHLMREGFVPMVVPHLVNEACMIGTGYFPGGEEQAYRCEQDGLSLIGTSEVPVASYHMDEILEESELPKRYCGVSTCYRREAGAAGRDTKGLYRIHQFDKVEQVVVCKNDVEESARHHAALLANAERVVQALGLPYRVVYVCTGDLGQGQVRKHDIECYMYSRGGYGETHSCSTFHEFQARRLKLRYRDGEGRIQYAHTLNNTAIASPRILISILEHYQEADGSVVVPEVLRPYMNGLARIGPPA